MTSCLFFGDSIIYGEYDGVFGGWVDLLKRYYHKKYRENGQEVNIFNLGIGGETTEGLLKRVASEANSRKSPVKTLLFISYGANDLAIIEGKQVVPALQFKRNLEEAILKAKAITDHVFIVSILPVSEKIDGITVASGKLRTNENVMAYNALVAEAALKNNTEYIDLYSRFFEDKEDLISSDGVHPNEKGYELISELVKPVIDRYL